MTKPPTYSREAAPSKTENETGAKSKSFDLTTSAGIAAAAGLLIGGGASAAILGPVAVIAGPIALMAIHLFRSGGTASKTTSEGSALMPEPLAPKSASNQQAELAIAILKAGKDQGLAEVEIIIESDTGIDIGAHLPKSLNIDLKLKAGRNKKITVRGRYKDS